MNEKNIWNPDFDSNLTGIYLPRKLDNIGTVLWENLEISLQNQNFCATNT